MRRIERGASITSILLSVGLPMMTKCVTEVTIAQGFYVFRINGNLPFTVMVMIACANLIAEPKSVKIRLLMLSALLLAGCASEPENR